MTLAANHPKPKSVRVADTLRDLIGPEARYKPGDQLPVTRELAKEFGVAGQTLRNGLAILVEEGLIFSAGNIGYFVSNEEERQAKSDLREEIKGIHSAIQELTARVAVLEKLAGSADGESDMPS
jgi:GntR family transcriptional regulator